VSGAARAHQPLARGAVGSYMEILPLLRAQRLILGTSLAAGALCACAAVLGIDDGHARDDGDGGIDAASIDVAPSDAIYADVPPVLPDGAAVQSGCEAVVLDPKSAIYVASTGTDGPACGTVDAPCKTIQFGIDNARASVDKPNVYVLSGVYVEQVTLKPGVNVYGGWKLVNGAWERECAQLATRIVAPPGVNVTVKTVDKFNGKAKLSTLYIQSRSDAKPGESLVGLSATGADTSLSLVWVSIRVANAGNGVDGPPGDPGAAPGVCDAGGDGASVTTPGAKGPGAAAGTFDPLAPTFYVVGNGGPGGAGASGQNGVAGGAGTCAACVTCSGGTLSCTANATTQKCGESGHPGCGGAGGKGGGGGTSGGSSVALFAWDANVELTSTSLEAGDGGRGGAGGPGGKAGGTSNGTAGNGSGSTCPTDCASLAGIGCSGTNDESGSGGDAGGPGGGGAAGGPGGDGAGGDSFAYIEGGNARVALLDDTTKLALTVGAPGAVPNGGNGAPGKAAPKGP